MTSENQPLEGPLARKLDVEIERWRELVAQDRAKGNLRAARDHGKRLEKLLRERRHFA
jgi:hypothetical protein